MNRSVFFNLGKRSIKTAGEQCNITITPEKPFNHHSTLVGLKLL